MVKNSERPSGGRILGVYFTKEELDQVAQVSDRLNMTRNAVIRLMVREYRPQPS